MTIYLPNEGETVAGEDEHGVEVEVPVEPDLIVKWMLDDAKTLGEAAARLRLIADEYEAAERDGWQLLEPIDGGHAWLARDSADSAPS